MNTRSLWIVADDSCSMAIVIFILTCVISGRIAHISYNFTLVIY